MTTAPAAHLIRRWADGGRGGFTEFAVGTNTIMDLKPLRDGGLAVGEADPLVAVLDANGRAVWRKTGEIADFRGQRGQWSFGVSADGQVIRFGFEERGKRPAEFSFRDLKLALDPPADPSLKGAVTETAAFAVTDWIDEYEAEAERHTAAARALRNVPQPRHRALGRSLPAGDRVVRCGSSTATAARSGRSRRRASPGA